MIANREYASGNNNLLRFNKRDSSNVFLTGSLIEFLKPFFPLSS